ncbi:hypothetical protein DV737_g4741, partial [Chaetothyriales sp. CBS 132003]
MTGPGGPGGLPTLPPSGPELSQAQAWNKHMTTNEGTDSAVTPPQDALPYNTHYPTTSEADRRAVSNLLEALKTAQTKDSTPQVQMSDQPVTFQVGALTDNGGDVKDIFGLNEDLLDNAPALDAFSTFTDHDPALASLTSLTAPSLLPPACLPEQQHKELAESTLLLPPDTLPPNRVTAPTPERREVEAFAKIEFEDGNYYITTWQCELGRDALAFKAARERAEAAKKAKEEAEHAQSSSGRISRPPDRIRRQEESHVQGSVVSDAGGFGGIDQGPVTEPKSDAHPSQSSQISSSDVVRPQEVLYHPPAVPFDYNRNAELQARALEPDNEEPAPVTAEHLPDANQCPIIPIHAMAGAPQDEVDTHRGISRRHVRIEWDFEWECFKLRVLGRNGCFVDGDWIDPGTSRKLTSGCRIQISSVQMTFRLPRPKTEPLSDGSGDEEENTLLAKGSASPVSNDALESPNQPRTNMTLTQANGAPSQPVGPDGQPLLRKRGPGRPPKDGQMSQRERRERAKAAALAEAKAANGGRTPPSMAGRKPIPIPEPPKAEAKLEKRKYQKRKRDEDGDVLPSIEGGEEDIPSGNDTPVQKKPRASKSPSPEYPPYASLTEEQLQRPNDPYAKLIYDLLLEIHPKALPLKGIYRMIKMRYPFFVYRVESDGWQSSVRHNLNQEWNKLFEKGDKEGKGFAWRAIPGAIHPQTERKRAAPAPPTSKLKPPPPRNPPHPNQHSLQTLNWQNNTQYLTSYWPQGQPGLHTPPNGIPVQGQLQPGFAPSSGFPRLPNSHSSTAQFPNYRSARQTLPLATEPRAPGTAAPNMPCTLEGIMLMRRFEESMYDQIREGANPQSLEYWQQAFGSARKRLLHGHPKSSMLSGETQEELVIMDYLRGIRDRFCNVNFVGFGEKKATPPLPAGPDAETALSTVHDIGPSAGGEGGQAWVLNTASASANAEAAEATAASRTVTPRPAVQEDGKIESNTHQTSTMVSALDAADVPHQVERSVV